MKTRTIGIVAYAGAQAMDITGPADAFAIANSLAGKKHPTYAISVVAPKRGRVPTESGISLYADAAFADAALFDTILVPGGALLRGDGGLRASVARWLRANERRARRVGSVCTGIYALAEAGLLTGRAATTHWRFADDVARRWADVRLCADRIFVKDGKYYTSAGVTAGIDLSLALIEEDFGNELALAVAREMVVYLKRSGGQLQYSQPLRLQVEAKGPFGDIAAWIRGNLAEDLTVERLAEAAGLSARHFTRKFAASFGITPAEFVEELRLDEARWLLVNAADSVDGVARDVGYASDDTFRRAFERRFGVAPSDYRKRFGAA